MVNVSKLNYILVNNCVLILICLMASYAYPQKDRLKRIKQRENIVTGCEMDVANLDAVHGDYKHGRLVFFLSRLGIGEKREVLSKKRLENIALYLKNAWDVKEDRMKESFVYARGSKVQAKGRVEVYANGLLVALIIAKKKDALSSLNNCPGGE